MVVLSSFTGSRSATARRNASSGGSPSSARGNTHGSLLRLARERKSSASPVQEFHPLIGRRFAVDPLQREASGSGKSDPCSRFRKKPSSRRHVFSDHAVRRPYMYCALP